LSERRKPYPMQLYRAVQSTIHYFVQLYNSLWGPSVLFQQDSITLHFLKKELSTYSILEILEMVSYQDHCSYYSFDFSAQKWYRLGIYLESDSSIVKISWNTKISTRLRMPINNEKRNFVLLWLDSIHRACFPVNSSIGFRIAGCGSSTLRRSSVK
jgi:hypothetical protein